MTSRNVITMSRHNHKMVSELRRAGRGPCLLLSYHRGPLSAPLRLSSNYGPPSSKERKRRLMLDRIIRVDHAGELGADRIYAGQHAVLSNTQSGPVIREMWEHEKRHLRKFEELIPAYRVRPSALVPFWNVAGFALGAGSALLGEKAAMACTVAVETVIGEHYDSQIRELLADSEEEHHDLLMTITQFRDEELHHLDTALKNDAEKAPLYLGLSAVIKTGCKLAIWLAERV